MTNELKALDQAVDLIVHEVNVAHSIDCNSQARYHILKQCNIINNKSKIKYNDLTEWIAGNPEASHEQIKRVIEKINVGDDVRGFKFAKIL